MNCQSKKYQIITIGCQMNKSDSERLAARLESLGMRQAYERKSADLVALVTCGVRQSAEDRIYGLAPRIKKENPKAKIVLTGCLVGREDVRVRLKNIVDIWLPINQISNFNQNSKFKCQKCNNTYFKIKPKYISNFSAFVPIGNGCDNFCAYCVVPYARGREVYRPAGEIRDEVKSLIKKGYKEIILIAQNVNSYKSNFQPACRTGRFQISNLPVGKQVSNQTQRSNDKCQNNRLTPAKGGYEAIDFADLLKMINNIPGDFWIRFSTSHPKDMSEKLIKTIAGCKKVCKHIHLPAQSGDNKILSAMNRKYTASHYRNLIKKIRKAINSKKLPVTGCQLPVAITTDIIVGFPGETKKQFNNSARLLKEMKFDMAYIACYSPRPGTAAARLKDNVPAEEKKQREEELMKILRITARENNKKYLGKIVKVLVENNKKGEYFGKTATGKMVRISPAGKEIKAGEFIEVKIIKAADFGLEGTAEVRSKK